jgi:hypothetical protein
VQHYLGRKWYPESCILAYTRGIYRDFCAKPTESISCQTSELIVRFQTLIVVSIKSWFTREYAAKFESKKSSEDLHPFRPDVLSRSCSKSFTFSTTSRSTMIHDRTTAWPIVISAACLPSSCLPMSCEMLSSIPEGIIFYKHIRRQPSSV